MISPTLAGHGSPPISVVIVNWNGGRFLLRVLEALQGQSRAPARVVVVDNGSSDGSDALVARSFPGVRLRRVGENVGFAAANNLALREEVETPWAALLNPDAVPERDWIERLWQGVRAHPGCSAYGCRMRRYDDPRRLDGTGDCYHPCGWGWRRDYGVTETDAHLQPGEIFAPCAAAALYRREDVLAIEGFDEDFFCYFEDVDLGFRLRLAGKRCFYLPAAIVRHVGSATTGRRSDFAVYHGCRNLIWCWWKNMPAPALWRHLPTHLLFNLLQLSTALRRGQGGVVLRAQRDALGGLLRMLRRRRRVVRRPDETATAAMTAGWRAPYRARRERCGD